MKIGAKWECFLILVGTDNNFTAENKNFKFPHNVRAETGQPLGMAA